MNTCADRCTIRERLQSRAITQGCSLLYCQNIVRFPGYTFRCSTLVAIIKYTVSEIASTIVVISGLAMTAGSKPSLWARSGKKQPMAFAKRTTRISVEQTIRAICRPTRSNSMSFRKLHTESVTPQSAATRISFQRALSASSNSISLKEIPRMMETLA